MGAEVLKGRKVAPGVVLKIVPATDTVWQKCLAEGIIEIFKAAGVLVGNAGCAGCAAGQLGQNGPGEVTISTGVAGQIAMADSIPDKPSVFMPDPELANARAADVAAGGASGGRPTVVKGRVWVVEKDNIDTDMIFHNRHLAITDIDEMGQHTFGNLPGWESFPSDAAPGDIVIVGSNFGCGSSRQQAVDCFTSLGVSLLIATSFGAIYERNAINAGMPILAADLSSAGVKSGDEIEVDLTTGRIKVLATGKTFAGRPFSDVQMEIYQRGGLLAAA